MSSWTARPSRRRSFHRRGLVLTLGLALGVLAPAMADAQYRAPELDDTAIGERYHVEVSGSLWNPALFGQISSEQFGIIGSKIDFVDDLDFEKTRFKDLRIVLRPTRKGKFRIQYTPVRYEAETSLRRDIVFNGQRFPLALPLTSEFQWNVWRLGYEYDFVYRSRGFVGFIIDVRQTKMTARLASPILTELNERQAPLPAIGGVGRFYVLPEVAINFEMTGFKVPDIDPKYKAHYYDWDLHGTINMNNNVGLQVGWRQQTNFLSIENDFGDLQFRGLWFGAALRY